MIEAALLDDPTFLRLLDEFTKSGLRELHVRRAGIEIYLSNEADAPRLTSSATPRTAAVPAPAPSESTSSTPSGSLVIDVPADATIVRAPNLGTFYRAPKPGAPSYVEVGAQVAAGDELCLIEVMKLFTAVLAPAAGEIVAILSEDGAMVEAGAPLFALRVIA